MKRIIALTAIALSLGACKYHAVVEWQAPQGRSFAQDKYACERENIGYYGGGPINHTTGSWGVAPAPMPAVTRSCLEAKGYKMTNVEVQGQLGLGETTYDHRPSSGKVGTVTSIPTHSSY